MRYQVFSILCVLFVASRGLQLHNMLPQDYFSCPRNNVTVTGLILARGGSKGIPLKNLVSIGNKSLLRRSVETMIESKKFEDIWVSTDNEMIALEAEKSGAKVHWRSAMSATDTASSLLAMQDFIHGHKAEVDFIGLIQCTSPFLDVKYLNEAFQKLNERYDSVFSVTREFKLRWMEREKIIMPLNLNPRKRLRRQDWSGELVENGMFYFTRRTLILNDVIQGGRIGAVEVDERDSIEIDNIHDLHLARYLFNKQLRDNMG